MDYNDIIIIIIILLTCIRYLLCFLQNQWQEMFPCLISKAATVDVICNGEGSNRNGAVQLVRGNMVTLPIALLGFSDIELAGPTE